MRNVRTGARWRVLAGVALCSATLLLTAARSNPTEAPLADAVMRGDTAKVRVLIKQGADVNASQPDGMSALHWASQRGDLASAQVLVYAGARVDAVTRNGNYTGTVGETVAGARGQCAGHHKHWWCNGSAFRRG
jgi:uncharacterized protein